MVSSKTEFIVRKAREMSMGFPVFSPGFLFSAFLAKFGHEQKKYGPKRGRMAGASHSVSKRIPRVLGPQWQAMVQLALVVWISLNFMVSSTVWRTSST